MIFDVAVGDRVRTVRVVRKDGLLHVTLDGHQHVIDARRMSDTALSLLMQNGQGDLPVQSIDASFAVPALAQGLGGPLRQGFGAQEGGGDFDVHIAGHTVAVQVRRSTWRTRHGASSALRTSQPGKSGPQRITSPMPGKIVRVLVKTGDQVKAKQGLVVVEAMKMENELRAARDGRVRELSVMEGQSVDAGAVLLTVD
jgi:biotin carboxyl carrier protein